MSQPSFLYTLILFKEILIKDCRAGSHTEFLKKCPKPFGKTQISSSSFLFFLVGVSKGSLWVRGT